MQQRNLLNWTTRMAKQAHLLSRSANSQSKNKTNRDRLLCCSRTRKTRRKMATQTTNSMAKTNCPTKRARTRKNNSKLTMRLKTKRLTTTIMATTSTSKTKTSRTLSRRTVSQTSKRTKSKSSSKWRIQIRNSKIKTTLMRTWSLKTRCLMSLSQCSRKSQRLWLTRKRASGRPLEPKCQSLRNSKVRRMSLW